MLHTTPFATLHTKTKDRRNHLKNIINIAKAKEYNLSVNITVNITIYVINNKQIVLSYKVIIHHNDSENQKVHLISEMLHFAIKTLPVYLPQR